jgi:NADPH:quinone reductase-like Zn-dependent oxidoreductase
MRAYTLQSSGPGQMHLELVDKPDPEPRPHEVVVRVRAVSLNYRDLALASGKLGVPPGRIPVSDGAGEVLAVGSAVRHLTVGQRVAGLFFQRWMTGPFHASYHSHALGGSIDGMLAEYVALEETGVVPIGDTLSYEEAATLPCAALTAWNALVDFGRISAGQTVLLLGTGGVSIFALQFAKLHGARVIITSSSDEKLERAKSLGADITINYRRYADWDKEVWAITEGHGADLVVEVGGAGTFERSLRSTRIAGKLAMIGILSGLQERINLFEIIHRSLAMQGIYVGSREMFVAMLAAMKQNNVKPVIGSTFDFADAQKAMEHMQAGEHFGKIVVRV